MIEELNALTFAAGGRFANVKRARPLVEEQTQIQRARIQHQPGMTAEVLVSKRSNLFVNGVFVTADAFGFPHGLQRCQNLADFTAQPPGVVSNARKCQLCFADVH